MSSAFSRNSALDQAVDATLEQLLEVASAACVVLVDGRSGSGKSTFAAELGRRWPVGPTPVVVPLDRLYPGWDGLEAGAAYAHARVLVPHAAGREASWQEWDWARERYDRSVQARPDRGLIVEGCGSLTAGSAPLAQIRVWLDAPEERRRDRALARDGESYRPYWDRWARQEDRHLARNAPRALATLVFDLG